MTTFLSAMKLFALSVLIVTIANSVGLITGRRFEQGVLFGALLAGHGGGHGGGLGSGGLHDLVPLVLGGKSSRRFSKYLGISPGHRGSKHRRARRPHHHEHREHSGHGACDREEQGHEHEHEYSGHDHGHVEHHHDGQQHFEAEFGIP